MWRAGSDGSTRASLAVDDVTAGPTKCGPEQGFTLLEMLVVMVMVAMAATAVTTVYRAPSAGVQVKAAALMVASRLRDLRASAMVAGDERKAEIEPATRVMRFSDGRAPLQLDHSIEVVVTAADGESRSPTVAGIRFFPNGSSSGATINLKSERQRYEVRVNWLTGRVSAASNP